MSEPIITQCPQCLIMFPQKDTWRVVRCYSRACAFALRHRSLPDRFWRKVTKTDSCWIWNASKSKSGYGYISAFGKAELAHRVAWFLAYGEWPSLGVLHKCDNPPCVNPDHLFQGDQTANMRDMSSKLRGAGFKLTEADARLAIEMRKSGATFREIGKRLGVGLTTVHAITSGKNWRWLHEEISSESRRAK